MKKITTILIILFLSTSFAYADDKEKGKILFEKLYEYTKRENISEIDFKKCRNLVKQIKTCKYYEHIIKKDDGSSEWYELGPLYAIICKKTKPELGIPAYIEHLMGSKSSASELLSTSFESLFRLHPEMVLDEIQKQDKSTQDYLLNRLYWGFLNNNPVEKEEIIKGRTETKRYPLDETNYEEVFYRAYPVLTDKYEKYKTSIDYILENCKSYFKWAEESQKKFEQRRRYNTW